MIIAIESASSDPSLALAEPDGRAFAVDGWSGENRQGSELLPRLLALLTSEGRNLDQASAVAVGIGPGSFTGLRVGMGIAKGIAMARNLPIVGVPSLEAWLAAEPEASAAVARAGADEAFLLRRGQSEPQVVSSEALRAALFTGPLLAAAELATAFELTARSPYRAAAGVALAAGERLAGDPAGDDLPRLEPTYLKAPRGLAEVRSWR